MEKEERPQCGMNVGNIFVKNNGEKFAILTLNNVIK
jgi:hypothetical protein